MVFLIILTLLFYLYNKLYCDINFYYYGNLKYKFLLVLSNYIYLGKIKYKEILALDNQNKNILSKRLEGLYYLNKKLNKDNNIKSKLTDCRFKKIKVLFPLIRELELPIPNFIKKIESNNVILNDNSKNIYLGSDAIHYFNYNFYQKINSKLTDNLNKTNNQFLSINLNPQLIEHSNKITEMTGMDEVRYALSGSEAVEIAFKDVKMSTSKNIIVRFKNVYHGHITGISNESDNQVFLNELDQKSLDFLERYHYKIAGVIINPMQYFTGPNELSPPGEKLTRGNRCPSRISKIKYAKWLHDLNSKCKYCTKYLTPIAFMLDDIYFAFRTKELFSFKYFKYNNKFLEPDIIILGKGVGGGYPLSIVCGKKNFMHNYDKNYILKINKSVGTFSAWEGGIVASNIFLNELDILNYDKINQKFENFTDNTNTNFIINDLPIRLHSFTNVFTIDYLVDSLFNSMYTQFLLAEGVYLSNQSTGKFNLSDEWDEKSLNNLTDKLVNAAKKMKNYGFFEEKKTNWWFLPILRSFILNFLINQYNQIMLDKKIDIEVSHNHPFNKFSHFWSSIVMIFISYPAMFNGNYTYGVKYFLYSHILRQSGHFFYERQDLDKEKLKFGHKDGTKKISTLCVFICIFLYYYKNFINFLSYFSYNDLALYSAFLTIIPHYAEICHKFGFLRGLQWIVKIFTDPFTDILDFYPYIIINPKYTIDFNFRNKII